ncbi:ferritin family protein [bacterium]|nr:ferritin family protein [bacterium]
MLNTVDEILDFAIREEEQAAAFYRELAARMDRSAMKKVFEDFAKEEDGHKSKLLAVKQGGSVISSKERVLDLKIAEYLLKVDPFHSEMDYQQALVVAMKKEKAAYLLYHNLSQATSDEALRDIFLSLANEEAKHKLRFEIEYDEHVLMWN